jgi:putative glycosyltransferase (TIGR04372 family)
MSSHNKANPQTNHRHWIYKKYPYLIKHSHHIRLLKDFFLKLKPFLIHTITLPIAITLRLFGFETINVNYTRIGHLCADIDAYLKIKMLFPNRLKPILFCNPSDFPNQYFINLLKDKIKIIKIPVKDSYIFCRILNSNPITVCDVSCFMEKEPQFIKNLYSAIGNFPLFSINQSETNEALRFLEKKLNKKLEKWVCIHYRDSNYTTSYQKGLKIPPDDYGQDFRNTNPNNLLPVVEKLNKLNIHVFLMGHDADFPIEDCSNFTNFSKCSWKTDFLDVYLSAKCLFYFGNSSGSAQISRMFGRPTIGSNLSLLHCFNGTNIDITAPKKYYDISLGRYLTLSEILKSPIRYARNADEYIAAGILLHENSAEELNLLLSEMLEKIGLIKIGDDNFDHFFINQYHMILSDNKINISINNSNISTKYLLNNLDFVK